MVSSNGGSALPDPRVQRVRRADSFCGPAPPPKDIKVVPTLKESPSIAGIKRAPSFGALAQEVKRDRHHVFGGVLKGPAGEGEKDLPAYPSSDEEEKIRSKGAKKMRVKEVGGQDLTISSPPPLTPPPIASLKRTKAKPPISRVDGKPKTTSPKSPTPKPKLKSTTKDMLAEAENKNALAESPLRGPKRVRPAAMNLQRNPSMFGAELPHVRGCTSPQPGPESPRARPQACPVPAPCPGSVKAKLTINTNPTSPPGSPQKVKTLRRVRRLAPARRISFGSLIAPGEDADGEAEEEDGDQRARWDRQRQRELGQLGSAFQLH
jgi:transcription factor SPN1